MCPVEILLLWQHLRDLSLLLPLLLALPLLAAATRQLSPGEEGDSSPGLLCVSAAEE